MASNTRDYNEDVELTSVMADASSENIPPSISQDDHSIKFSESVVETTVNLTSQAHSATSEIVATVATSTLSSGNPVNQNTTAMSSSTIVVETDSVITSGNARPCMEGLTESKMKISTTKKYQKQLQKKNHIMISYNRASASIVSQKIYDRLKQRNRKVWYDKQNLTFGSIIQAMGEAVDNSSVVLLLINEAYSESEYCLMEAKYAVERKIPIIPCMLDEEFRPDGGLGMTICDRLYIKFSDENEFDQNFEDLIIAINAAEAGLNVTSDPVDNMNFRDRFKGIMTEYIESIKKSQLNQQNINESELGTVLFELIKELAPETLKSFQHVQTDGTIRHQIHERNTDLLLQALYENSNRLIESARTQQENYRHILGCFLQQDDRITAFINFQRKQDEEKGRHDHSEYLRSLFHIQEIQEQRQERNDRITTQILEHIEQLTELVISQQQQYAAQTEYLRQLATQSLENNELLRRSTAQNNTLSDVQQQQQHGFHFDFNTLKNLVQSAVLLCTLVVILNRR